MHTIKKIIDVEPYKITVKFSDDTVGVIDLEEKFREWSQSPKSKFKELLNPTKFLKVKLNSEIETIYWDNGIDLCPDVLYELSKSASVLV